MFSKSVLGKRSATPRKSPFKRRRITVQAAVQRAVRKATATEPKYVETAISQSVDTAAPVVTPLSLVAQGDGFNERIGRTIKGVYLSLRFTVLGSATTAANLSTYVRCVVVQDRDQVGTAPTATDFYGTATPAVTEHRALQAVNAQRFIVLMDEVYTVNSQDQTTASIEISQFNKAQGLVCGTSASVYVQKHLKIRAPEMRFVADTAASASNGTNHIYLITITNAAAGEDITVTGQALMKYFG